LGSNIQEFSRKWSLFDGFLWWNW